MRIDKTLFFLTIVAVITFSFAIKLNFIDQSNSLEKTIHGFFTGKASSGINFTIENIILINFTVDAIDWGIGSVYGGSTNATLDTSLSDPIQKCFGGNWTGAYTNDTNGLTLENIGNLDAVVFLKTGKNANVFLGGSEGGGPLYRFNVTNSDLGSCNPSSELNLSQWYDVNTSSGDGTKICENFSYESFNNSIRIDVLLRIPADSFSGYTEDSITATAYAT